MKLYVGNLSFETTENDLQDLFEKHGAVNEVHLMMDRMSGRSRGFAFVTMSTPEEAQKAIEFQKDMVVLRIDFTFVVNFIPSPSSAHAQPTTPT